MEMTEEEAFKKARERIRGEKVCGTPKVSGDSATILTQNKKDFEKFQRRKKLKRRKN